GGHLRRWHDHPGEGRHDLHSRRHTGCRRSGASRAFGADSRRHRTSGSMMRTLCLVLCVLFPAGAGAQVTTGKTASGLHYEMSGSGEPVVLIHAFSVDRRMWAPQIAALEKRFRVIRYDQRGHGNSGAPVEPYAPHDDLRSVLDALGVGRATLVGLSAGSTLA